MSQFGLALRLALREMRGGIRGFRIFLACLALGVAAIAAIGTLAEGVREGLKADAQKILGGDVEVRRLYRPFTPEQRSYVERAGPVSTVIEMRAMAYAARNGAGEARPEGQRDRLLVELKAVDGRYPLYGSFELGETLEPKSAASLAAALAVKDGLPGAVVDDYVLTRLGLKLGDRIKIGAADYQIRATVGREPDRALRAFTLGPRIMIGEPSLAATGLIQPGSLVWYHYRVQFPPGFDGAAWAEALAKAFPGAGWRVRNLSEAAPGTQNIINRIALYLTLVGLTALLIGGLGVANGVRTYLEGRTDTIATMKCVGAPAGLVFRTYLIQLLFIAAIGIVAGLVLGNLLPLLLGSALSDILPINLRLGIYPGPLLLATAFGVLTVLAFSLWALARAREVPAATLFRHAVMPGVGRPKPVYAFVTAALVAALAALAVLTAVDKILAAIFVGACAAAFLIFRVVAWLVTRTAKRATRPGSRLARRAAWRFALTNLYRPGAPTGSIVLSLGMAVTVLVTVALIQGNLANQVRSRMPDAAPSFYFIDIQPDQVRAFDASIRAVDGRAGIERMPMVRGNIVKINGVPAAEWKSAENIRWALENERGLTYSAAPVKGMQITQGDWWPENYTGPALISFDAEIAKGLGIGIGDTITFNVVGKEIDAKIGNLRRIDWTTLGMNFTTIFAPGTLEAAPHMHIATVRVNRNAEDTLLNKVTDELPNVSAIRVRDALDAASRILGNINLAVNSTASVTILAGLLVLAGAVAAGHRRRVYDAVVLKVLGATRGRILRAFLLEYGLLGAATTIVGAVLGTATANALMKFVMRGEWAFLPVNVVVTGLLCVFVALSFGFVGTAWAMGQKPAPLLRNE
ncbi:MAG: ABC transporter permease [Alphaproteobacteria bacterium]